MPHSRHRHKHQSHQPHHRPVATKPKRKATPIATFLIAVFGLVMGALASQSNFLWMASRCVSRSHCRISGGQKY